MVTSDEKVGARVQVLKDTLGKDSATPVDVTVTEFTSGNQQYLDWVKEQTNLPAGEGTAPEDATFLEELLDDN